ncbi:MAG: murein biosynthesis integral membrane protein MurJ, partial [Actinobacteria bacterium]|nr:murein biosynthesis integral membrane protein MurJ [Actinomycetota bacterium]
AYSFMFIVQRAFFALSDARTPFVFMSAQLVALVIGTLIISVTVPPEHLVLVYSIIWSLTTIAQAVFAVWLLRRRLHSVHGRSVLQSLVKYLIAVIPAAVIGWLITGALRGIAIDTSGVAGLVLSVVFALACSAVMALVYFGVLVAMRVPELRGVLRRLRRR